MGRARSRWVRLRGEGAVGLGLEHGRDVTCGVGRARLCAELPTLWSAETAVRCLGGFGRRSRAMGPGSHSNVDQ